MTETTDLPEFDDNLPVGRAWSRVMRDIGGIAKRDKNDAPGQKYMFRGVDAVVNAVGPALRRHGVFIVPLHVADAKEERYLTSNDKAMHGVVARFVWRVYGPCGDHFDMESLGEASDAGDKAWPKAHSVAFRTVLLESLCVPTDDPDPDSESHERGPLNNDPPADPNARDQYGRTSAEAQAYTLATRKLIAEAVARNTDPQQVEAAFVAKEGISPRGEPITDESGAVVGCTVNAAQIDAFREWYVAQELIRPDATPEGGAQS